MPTPKPPGDASTPQQPTTPAARRASISKPTTPANRKASANAGATPKSAPAGVGGGAKKKPEPTLLHDFLLGRPSPQRAKKVVNPLLLHQQQQRRKSVGVDAAAVKEELRQEFRAAAVRKLQQPGGVKDRVKQWQKTNAAAIKSGVAFQPEVIDDVASEPTEILVNLEDKESVTEEDRLRIKMRQKTTGKKRRPKSAEGGYAGRHSKTIEDNDGDDDEEGGGVVIHQENPPVSKPPPGPRPKKRIISDSHWMKQGKGKSPPRGKSPKVKDDTGPAAPIPKNFLQQTARNPPVRDKIKDWAQRVEIPAPPPPKVKKYETKTGDTITIEEEESLVSGSTNKVSKATESMDDGIRVAPVRSDRSGSRNGEGLKIKPIRVKRVRQRQSPPPEDVIVVESASEVTADEVSARTELSAPAKENSARTPSHGSGGQHSRDDNTQRTQPEQGQETPTRRRTSGRRRPKRRSPSPTTAVTQDTTSTHTDEESTEVKSLADKPGSESDRISESDLRSDLPSIAPGSKKLADIPVGFSAFSELDLPLGAEAKNSAKRPKQTRNGSFKAVPKVLKKVVTEGKKILQEKVVDAPRPVVNQPPSIETWLNTTVDPFVDTATKPKEKVEKEWVKATHRRTSSENQISQLRPEEARRPKSTELQESQDAADAAKEIDDDITPRKAKTPTSGSAGLKRRSATRSRAISSPLKPMQKKSFKEQLKEAFTGESSGHKLVPIVVYPSVEADDESSYVGRGDGSDSERRESRRSSSGSSKRSRSRSRSPTEYTTTVGSSSSIGPLPADARFPRSKPPTRGDHELSTIVSEETCSTCQSDTVSTFSQPTITPETSTLTRSTDTSRGSRSGRSRQSSSGGLRRRLTKHSELVSVLSLPDNDQLLPPKRARSVRSGGKLLRKTSKLQDNTTLDDLLEEFADDEYFYQRELKTLVDGVIPVLLTQVVDHNTTTDPNSKELFGGLSNKSAEKLMAKAVVEMGTALEKLKDFHRRVPVSDIHAVLLWLDSVYPIYDNYLDAWRLGFQDLIINLAPASGKPEDEDSLVNAMPRNEVGDVLDERGEPVDVAHLLKRPLIRIKWMVKLIRGTRKSIHSLELNALQEKFEILQEKARRRHREETARKEDEDANNTDVTRTRDLRTLAAADNVKIDQSRQVNAKDIFMLDLQHSSGQRLECRVEVIFRDNVKVPTDHGDILFRETGARGRSWLLFPPIPKQRISARRGEGHGELTVMVRGSHQYKGWSELLTLSTDDEDQIADWLDIFTSNPLPPTLRSHHESRMRAAATPGSPTRAENDVPVGARKPQKQPPPENGDRKSPVTPSRYHNRNPSFVVTPPTPASAEKTFTQDSHDQQSKQHDLPPPQFGEQGSNAKDRAELTKSSPSSASREEGAPPPVPVHRTLGPKSPPLLSPPVITGAVKRRRSSPLKHEYHASDVSSESSASSDSEGSDTADTASSSDELEDSDVPDLRPAISIRGRDKGRGKEIITSPDPSVVSDDANSLSPSNSASHGGLVGASQQSIVDFSIKAIASISYWSAKVGQWKDVSTEACSLVVTPGLIEAFSVVGPRHTKEDGTDRPLIALELTPVVLIRTSNSVDLEIHSPVRSYSVLHKIDGTSFRFRSPSMIESKDLYEAVHRSRMNNAKYRAIEEEARFRSFGQPGMINGHNNVESNSGDGSTSSRKRSWFGRKNSYRASTRAPSESQGSSSLDSSNVNANSFLDRFRKRGNQSYDIDASTVDKQSRPGSMGGGPLMKTPPQSGPGSLYSSSASSSGRYGFPLTHMRSPSVSLADTGTSAHGLPSPETGIPIRLYYSVPNTKAWKDRGNCILRISRPPKGMHQELAVYHGMEKRVSVFQPTKNKKTGEMEEVEMLDAVLGSGCFDRLGTKGVVVKVWEDIRDKNGNVGRAPANGGVSGKMRTWCFQTRTTTEASWVVGFLTQEVSLG